MERSSKARISHVSRCRDATYHRVLTGPNPRWRCGLCFVGGVSACTGNDDVIKVKNGIETEDAKKITKVIKESKLKVQASIQGDAVRVTGAKRDDLQAAMALLRKDMTDLPLSFDNFRD